MPMRLSCLPGFVAAVLVGILCRSLLADVIVLQSGGELRGEFLNDQSAQKAADVQIRTLTGAVITVQGSEVKSVMRRPIVHEQYEQRCRKVADTLQGQWELAQWCGLNNLRDRRQTHLRRVLDFDPDHKEARRLLGYRFVDGRWLTQDEIMAARGLVKYKGQYRSPQDAGLLLEKQMESELEKRWYPKVRLWYGWANDSRPERQNEGMAKLKAIRDPNALPALSRTMAGDQRQQARLLYVKVLAAMNDERVVGALVNQSLLDESAEVRELAVQAVGKAGAEKALPRYIQALQNDTSVIVNRAAYALGELARRDDMCDVVPPLISSLVTIRKYRVPVVDKVLGMAVHHEQFIGGLGDTLKKVNAMIQSGELPYGAEVRVGFPPGLGPHIKQVTVQDEQPNASVLKSLTKLTGKDFGHNVSNWRVWWLAESPKYLPRAAEK